jgi:hypothetical protein
VYTPKKEKQGSQHLHTNIQGSTIDNIQKAKTSQKASTDEWTDSALHVQWNIIQSLKEMTFK